MSRLSRMGHALYEGKVSIDFVGRKWLWYAISGLIVLVAVLGLTVKGLNMGIEFEGGVEYRVSMASGSRRPDGGRGHPRRGRRVPASTRAPLADRQHLGRRTTSGSRPSR